MKIIENHQTGDVQIEFKLDNGLTVRVLPSSKGAFINVKFPDIEGWKPVNPIKFDDDKVILTLKTLAERAKPT